MLRKIKWFWKESGKYTGYNPVKLLQKGFVSKCIWFLSVSRDDTSF